MNQDRLDTLVGEVLDSTREWFDGGEKWTKGFWYKLSTGLNEQRIRPTLEENASFTRVKRVFNNTHVSIGGSAIAGCLVGGVDHNIWRVAVRNDLTPRETFLLESRVYNKISSTLKEQYPELKKQYPEKDFTSINTLFRWNDKITTSFPDVERVLDKAARSIDG